MTLTGLPTRKRISAEAGDESCAHRGFGSLSAGARLSRRF